MDERQKRRRNYNRQWVSAKRKTLSMTQTQNEHIETSCDSDSDGDSSVCSAALNDEGPQCDNVIEDRCLFTDADSDVVWDVIDAHDTGLLSSSDSEREDDVALYQGLVEWVNKHSIKHTAVDDLLKLLKSHGHDSLPSSARTLLKTDRQVTSEDKSGMKYVYLGIETSVVKHFDKYPLEIKQQTNILPIALNIDGLPLFRSSNTVLWPILCSILIQPITVFPIAVTCGKSKPENLDFLQDTVEELSQILQNGLQYEGRDVRVTLRFIACDAPARDMVKGMKQYSGYFGCDKCAQKGVWLGRMTFPEIEHFTPRTNQSFRDWENAEHHHTVSPFTALPIDMVKTFPIDYMHQTCLGVMRRLILLWTRGKKETKLSARHVQEINARLSLFRPSIPKCFARKPRGFDEIDRWKATEFRQFLLYTGKIVLKGILRDDVFTHFMALSVAMCILISPKPVHLNSQYAQSPLVYFVKQGHELYGPEFLVYNVHSLLHVADDAAEFGSIDRCGGFAFENYLQHIKKLVRCGKNPLTQVVKRIHELDSVSAMNKPACRNYSISVNRLDNTFILADDSCCEVVAESNEGDDDGSNKFLCRIYTMSEPFFVEPCDSHLIGVYKTSLDNSRMKLLSRSCLYRQAIILASYCTISSCLEGCDKKMFTGHRVLVLKQLDCLTAGRYQWCKMS